jgi:hypothetical protein
MSRLTGCLAASTAALLMAAAGPLDVGAGAKPAEPIADPSTGEPTSASDAGRRSRCGPARGRRARRRGRGLATIYRRPRRRRCTGWSRLGDRRPVAEGFRPARPVSPGPTSSDPVVDPPPTAKPPLPGFVSVVAAEWSLTLSRPVVKEGSVGVELRNVGEDAHNLIVSRDRGLPPLAVWPEIESGDHLTRWLTLSAGSYRLWCSLEGHEAAGMSVRLRVE